MREYKNSLGQPISFPVPEWQAAKWPQDTPMIGERCRLEPFKAAHIDDLYAAFIKDSDGHNWTYLPYGPFASRQEFAHWTEQTCYAPDPKFYSVIAQSSGKAVGMASYLRIDPNAGVIEVGHIHFSPLLQGTTLATEAMYLMMQSAFAAGYRRYEWKCDGLNNRSRNAALRLGFNFEGIFHQATLYKNRNRDTAWFAILDTQWAANRAAFVAWLSPDNFTENGQQRKSLADYRADNALD